MIYQSKGKNLLWFTNEVKIACNQRNLANNKGKLTDDERVYIYKLLRNQCGIEGQIEKEIFWR